MFWFLAAALAAPVTLFLQDPRTHDRPADRCTDDHCQALLQALHAATTSIDFAVYGFRDQSAVLDALYAARDRGVRVRGVVDADAKGRNYYAGTEAVLRRLPTVRTDEATDRASVAKASGFRMRDRCERPEGFDGPLQCLGYGVGPRCLLAAHASREAIVDDGDILHHKFFVVDGRILWTGSTNVSDSGTGGYNANLVVRVEDPEVAGWYTREFEAMYEQGTFHHDKPRSPVQRRQVGSTHVTGLFSPQDRPLTKGVRPLLAGAKRRIDIAVFFLTHKHVTADLIAAHRRGVRVRVILDATAAKNGYSKHTLLQAVGIPVAIETWGGKMHAKAAVIDDDVLIAGSMNWTSAGEGGNDENTLLLRNPALVQQFDAWFEPLWKGLAHQGRPDPESWSSGTSCTDGVDNDFDHLADAADPGCSANPPPVPALPPYRWMDRKDGEGILVKGAQVEGKPVYLQPWHPDYDQTRADRWFCSRFEAEDEGYRRLKGKR